MEIKDLGKIFGERLKQKRIERSLLQEDVGAWFQMGKSTVSQWEAGRIPHASIIVELARRFHVTTDWLLGCDDSSNQPICKTSIFDDLPSEAIQNIEEYIELMKLKYNNKKPATNK